MSIRFLDNSPSQFIRPIYPQWGNIGMGQMQVSSKGNSYPTETPHFVFKLNAGYEDLQPIIARLYGEQPMSLDMAFLQIVYHQNPVEAFMPNSMQAWAKSKHDPNKRTLTIECDSETVIRVFDYQTKKHIYEPNHKCGWDGKACQHGCKPTARLRVVLPALVNEVDMVGYFEMTLHGLDSIRAMLGAFRQLDNNIGTSILRITRTPKTMTYTDPQDGKTKERKFHPISSAVLIGQYEGIMLGSGNVVSGQLPAPQPRHDDVNTGSDYTDDDYQDDSEDVPMSPPPAPEKPTLEQVTIRYLYDKGYQVTSANILDLLGYETWDELYNTWQGKCTPKTVGDKYIQVADLH